ncbi:MULTISPECIES: isoaspartyl peptidase/L-asparaginase family protein [unclassified Arsukibacterium]|uniref:isoaspartyl peptidase/L-asparaginase family protein n=1 Tax=unclassified Arsukibacterium TaxID=2635278 RepID=UPI000C5C6580|nr:MULTISPECIES: isoaspartyl peptidase/L-asparaginase [unclassified Arsukibacterium]MAA96057.1 beta-aspartyl-peptidase [Rheinheimera sp.]MBM33261.1 beta-aspartyl-peptidase [Rheinheimera sp.]HAW91742.1 beta-aspartyl-peptidase [Candidatus Azambacteria bacterium]
MKRLLLILALGMPATILAAAPPVGIVIHGGAGTIDRSQMSSEQQKNYEATLAEAVNKGYELLAAGGSSVDAVTLAVTVLENSPLFNAGKGAVYTWEETHELDAAIMMGQDRNAGAVASVTTVKNPILLARAVMEKSEHVMLTGKGAEQFALAQQLEQVDNSYFNTEFRYEALKRARQAQQSVPHQAAIIPDPNWKMGTVGAVAIDKDGNLAAATSTGGMTAKRWGRVGDVPVIGAGNFADNTSCAVSGTGHGEYFIRYNVASDICARVKYQGKNAAVAAKEVITELLDAGGTGGVIVVDAQGELSWAFNTPGMYRAKRNHRGTVIEIFADESEKISN